MNEQDYLNCIKTGADLYWRTLGRCRGMALHQGDIEYVMSDPRGNIERIFNVQSPPDDADRMIAKMISDMKKGIIPDNILILPGTDRHGLTERLAEKGFEIDKAGACMALDLAALREIAPAAAPIEVREVSCPNDLREWTHIVNDALFECDLLSFEQFSDMFALENTVFHLGLYDGQPAATAMTIRDHDIATLEMVATLPEYRRRGLGRAVVERALKRLRDCGVKTATLRAEPVAVELYRQVGFRDYGPRVVANRICEKEVASRED